ncbi:phosphoribosylamine--glycine ligase [soil metagenome]
MNILIIGNGGREHAMAWKVAQSAEVTKVYVAPGNTGTALEPKVENITIAALDIAALIQFAKDNAIALTIVGPEAPLAAGIVDQFSTAGLACFGPSQKAAQLESSKAFSKAFMQRHNIPTARFASFTDFTAAKDYLQNHPLPVVIKADGLAAGKGVVIAHNYAEALQALTEMLLQQTYAQAGQCVVIEEFIEGEEVSFIVMVDGEHAAALATSQDHKTRDEGDQGPNTGGMGAYSPAALVTADLHQHIMETVISPTVRGMAAEGMPYTGFLYAGLMITARGEAKVLEFNFRLGDPEAQVLLVLLKSDLAKLLQLALQHNLHHADILWDPRPALGVVLAAEGYPETYRQGDRIEGLNQTDTLADTKIFHAGTAKQNETIATAGGRVLCACALGDTLSAAQQHAYMAVNKIHWQGMFYRRDIGHRALQEK